MQVSTVHYERRMSDGNYGNRSMSVTAVVDEGDSPSEILMMLRDLVVARLAEDEEREIVEAAKRDAARLAQYDAERASRLKRSEFPLGDVVEAVEDDDEEDIG